MRLDVGCGNTPTGNVNCDLYPEPSPHHDNIPLDLRKIPNFVKCDAGFLPFKDVSFDEVYASHLLEHFSEPSVILKEMLRVSSDSVVVVVPHRVARKGWLRYKQDAVHKQFFDAKNLQQWLTKMHLSFKVQVIMRPFPNDILPIISLPWEIRAEIKKA